MKCLTSGEILLIFVEPAFGKARHSYFYFGKVNVDGCVCVCMCILSRFVQAITPTFMHGFQNYLAQLLFLRRSAI